MDKVQAFKEILEQDPANAFARYGLAMEYRQRGEISSSIEQFDELQQRHPDYIAGYQMAAQTLMAEDRIEEAEQRLQAGMASARRVGNQHALHEMEGMLEELQERI
jgi:predicted Zn-dependent protease